MCNWRASAFISDIVFHCHITLQRKQIVLMFMRYNKCTLHGYLPIVPICSMLLRTFAFPNWALSVIRYQLFRLYPTFIPIAHQKCKSRNLFVCVFTFTKCLMFVSCFTVSCTILNAFLMGNLAWDSLPLHFAFVSRAFLLAVYLCLLRLFYRNNLFFFSQLFHK